MTDIAQSRIEPGCVVEVGAILDALRAESVFLVRDRHAYAASGAQAALEPQLADREVVVFEEFAPNPKYLDVTRGVELFWKRPCDVVLAVGGGSAIDMGKLIGFCAAQREAPVVVLTNRAQIRRQPCPLIAVPTTAGTGSEATHFAVVYVDDQKYSVAHEWILPTCSLVDPELTAAMPPALTAHTGLDAFCQAVESMWSVHSTDRSREYAKEALGLVRDHLEKAVLDPTPGARWAMCKAAHLAGQAINIGKTTAPHALSYMLTSQYGAPHGLAVALTLGPILVFNAGVTPDDVCDGRGADFVRARLDEICALLGVSDADAARDWIGAWMNRMGCPTRLSEVGVKPADLEQVVLAVNAERLANNPRALPPEALRSVLGRIL